MTLQETIKTRASHLLNQSDFVPVPTSSSWDDVDYMISYKSQISAIIANEFPKINKNFIGNQVMAVIVDTQYNSSEGN